jgi:LysM repeat protein
LKIIIKAPTQSTQDVVQTKPIVSTISKKDTLVAGMISYDTVVKITHTVSRNESLTFIANKYNVTVEDIKKWNGLTTNWLNIDQKLVIQQKVKLSKPGLVPQVKEVETPKPIENKPTPPAPVKKYYTVKSGDLFNRVAQKHGLTMAQLQKLNPGVNPNKIREGQQLRVK